MNMEDTVVRAETPEDAVRLYTARLNNADVDGLLELYDAEASFSPQEGTTVSGEDGIRAAVIGFTSMQPKTVSDVKWVQQVGDFALVLNQWTLEGRQPDGELIQMSGRSADVLHRGSDGGWRFYIDCVWACG